MEEFISIIQIDNSNNYIYIGAIFLLQTFFQSYNTQVNRMSRSRRVLAIGGKHWIFGLDMVCIETILSYLDSF